MPHLDVLKVCLHGFYTAVAEKKPLVNQSAPKTNRTSDLPLRRGLLYPLSYRGEGRIIALREPALAVGITVGKTWKNTCK
jgi:hypothetical protein